MKLVDLHIHTTASDGSLTPEALMEEVVDKGVAVFSVTDHDSVESIPQIATLAENAGVTFVPGVEVSVAYGEQELHILTYGVSVDDPMLLELLEENQKIRKAHNDALIKYASESHGHISFEDYEAYVEDRSRGGWKSLNYLVEKNVTENLGAFFDLVKAFDVPLRFQDYDQVIPRLMQCGYTLVLAHPPAYFKGERLSEAFLDELVEMGIQGIECYSPYFKNPEDQSYYLEYCKKRNLNITSGSDYHGTFIASRKLCEPSTTIDSLELKTILK